MAWTMMDAPSDRDYYGDPEPDSEEPDFAPDDSREEGFSEEECQF